MTFLGSSWKGLSTAADRGPSWSEVDSRVDGRVDGRVDSRGQLERLSVGEHTSPNQRPNLEAVRGTPGEINTRYNTSSCHFCR